MDEEIKIQIKGTTPLLCNNFTDMTQITATTGNKSAMKGDKGSPRTQAEQKLCASPLGWTTFIKRLV